MAEKKRKPLEEVLDQGLEKLVMISPNKKTYDEITSIMFQLYNGNDYGMGNFSLQFLSKIIKLGERDENKLQKGWDCL